MVFYLLLVKVWVCDICRLIQFSKIRLWPKHVCSFFLLILNSLCHFRLFLIFFSLLFIPFPFFHLIIYFAVCMYASMSCLFLLFPLELVSFSVYASKATKDVSQLPSSPPKKKETNKAFQIIHESKVCLYIYI